MKKGKNVMKNKKATNKNIQKKAMKDKKKKALARLKMPRTVDDVEALLEADSKAQKLKKKAPRHLKDKKNLKRPAAGDPERKMKGPRTPILKGPVLPDVSLTPEEGYYKLFKLTCAIIPPRSSSSRKRIVVGVIDACTPRPWRTKARDQRLQTPILKGPLMPDASLMPEENYFKPFQLTCMVIPPKTSSSANRLVVGVVDDADIAFYQCHH
jgi:hypothetical protein